MAGWHPRSRIFDVELNGAPERCHVVDVGPADGPPLVLLHGIAVSSWAWRMNLEPLAAHGLRVIAICHRGHGWSGRGNGAHDLSTLSRFVLAALDHLGVARASFAGNSLGGAVSLWTASHEPDRVERLILINPASHLRQRPWPLLGAIGSMRPLLENLYFPSFLRIPLAAIAYRGLPIDRRYMAGFWAPYAIEHSVRALFATARALPAAMAALDARLHEIAHPTLVIWGERDQLLPAQGGHHLIRRLPQARLVLLPGVGHCPHEEAPERTNALIADALAGLG